MGIVSAVGLYVENPACRRGTFDTLLPLLGWGAFGGLFGSLLDSLLGATLQATRYSTKSKHILADDSAHIRDADVKVVAGIPLLTNNQVNLISSIVTALLLAWIA
jgi:uncharacterized membrane protein